MAKKGNNNGNHTDNNPDHNDNKVQLPPDNSRCNIRHRQVVAIVIILVRSTTRTSRSQQLLKDFKELLEG